MLSTRTGSFPIGFRRGDADWQKNLDSLLRWATSNGLGVIDVGADADVIGSKIVAVGLRIGSADLRDYNGLLSPDKGRRAQAIANNTQYIRSAAAVGVRNFFCLMLPEKPDLSRRENFAIMIETLAELAPTLERAGACMVVEGWPGPGALCCTPESFRAMFKQVPSPAIAMNYDPSHLIRMGIDPIRFLEEFVGRVRHVHGKDTEILSENLYEYGCEQPATFAEPFFCGAWHWRYTIPGHGQMRWIKAFSILRKHGYAGAVSVELEDASYTGSAENEQAGILAGARYLESC